jgi:hypothetical protein
MREYVSMQRKNPKQNTGNILTDNVQAVSSAVQAAARLPERDRDSVARILGQETNKALQMRFLTEFDFRRCKFLDLPDFFFQ